MLNQFDTKFPVEKTDGSPGIMAARLDQAGFIVCDDSGRVQLCSDGAARLFRAEAAVLTDTPLVALLRSPSPRVGARSRVAWSSVPLVDQPGWQRYMAFPRVGRSRFVDATIKSFVVDGHTLFLLRLRPHAAKHVLMDDADMARGQAGLKEGWA